MKDAGAMGWPQRVAIQDRLQPGKLIERSRVHTGLLWAPAPWAVPGHTTPGFQIRAVGADARGRRGGAYAVGCALTTAGLHLLGFGLAWMGGR